MKKVFIDAGANRGQSIDNFIKHWPDWQEYDIHSFEANPRLVQHFKRFDNMPNIQFYNKAVWLTDDTVEFYLDGTSQQYGSSIIGTKISGNLDKIPTIVPSVDIANFIQSKYSKDDYIILKLDIEGGEYELIEYMVDTNTFEYIDEFYLEFHTHKVGKTKDDNNQLLNKMNVFSNMKVNYESYNGLNFL